MGFTGNAHDILAASAYKILLKPGHGFLHHPVYGIKRVAITGDIVRDEDTLQDRDYSSITVTFTETLPDAYPNDGDPTEGQIAESYGDVMADISSAFEASWDTSGVEEGLSAIQVIQKTLRLIKATIHNVTKGVKSIEHEIIRDDNILNMTMDTLIGEPLTLLASVYSLFTAPARSFENAKLRIGIYGDMFEYNVRQFKALFQGSDGFPGLFNNDDDTVTRSKQDI
jgi:prophage DNA circulation protein